MAAIFAAFLPGAASADASPGVVRSYVGVQGLLIGGVHRDVLGSQYGLGGGPLAEIHVGFHRAAIDLEGIPVISVPGTRPSVRYGQATPALGVFNGGVEFALDSRGREWAGIGATIYNQRTPLPALQQQVTSRIAGIRYTVRYREPLRGGRFVEALAGVAPVLFGTDHFVYSDGVTPQVNKDERASEVDASLAYGWRRNASEWLLGIRALNFSAKFVRAGDGADRNAGIGVMLEWRHLILHRPAR